MQRVPKNDNRRHSSTVTVVILPEPPEGAVDLNDRDLQMDFYRSGGNGGQHAQKNSTAVRITHLPSGLVASCEEERSQWRNIQLAKRVLAARLQSQERAAAQQDRNKERREQMAGGERSARAWTWQYQRDQLTEHQSGRKWRISRLADAPPC